MPLVAFLRFLAFAFLRCLAFAFLRFLAFAFLCCLAFVILRVVAGSRTPRLGEDPGTGSRGCAQDDESRAATCWPPQAWMQVRPPHGVCGRAIWGARGCSQAWMTAGLARGVGWRRAWECQQVFVGLDDGGPGPWGWVAPRPGVSACVLLPGCERSGPPVRRFRSLLWAVLPVSLREGAIVAVFVRSEALG